jgi:uncharacterized Fe-S center protein
MASNVYFADLRAKTPQKNTINKVQNLFDAAGFAELLKANALTAIKVHFGEFGNDGYISPVFVRQVVEKVRAAGAKPFLTDTNTFYSGSRHNAVDHLITAIEHGFAFSGTHSYNYFIRTEESGSLRGLYRTEAFQIREDRMRDSCSGFDACSVPF